MCNLHRYYRIKLPRTNEYIQETSSLDIWIKTRNIKDAFWTSDLDDAKEVAKYIANEKHLELNEGIVIEAEWFQVHTERIDIDE
jgi:hypothetical protein